MIAKISPFSAGIVPNVFAEHWEDGIIHVCASDQTWPWKHNVMATLPFFMGDNELTQDGEVPKALMKPSWVLIWK